MKFKPNDKVCSLVNKRCGGLSVREGDIFTVVNYNSSGLVHLTSQLNGWSYMAYENEIDLLSNYKTTALYSGTTMPTVFKVGDKVRTTKTITPKHNGPSLPIDSQGTIISVLGHSYRVEFTKYNVTSVVWADEIQLDLPSGGQQVYIPSLGGHITITPKTTGYQKIQLDEIPDDYFNKYVNDLTKPKAKLNVCTCGSEKVHGPSTRHSDWCDKKG